MDNATILSHLFQEVSHVYRESGTITENVLAALQFVVPVPLQNSLDLIDRKSITKLTAIPSGRFLYQVLVPS